MELHVTLRLALIAAFVALAAGVAHCQEPQATLPLPPANESHVWFAGVSEPGGATVRLPPVTPDEMLFEGSAVDTALPWSDDSFPNGEPEGPETAISFGWLAGGGAAGFDTVDLDFCRSWLWTFGSSSEPVVITPGAGLHLWSGPIGLDLPPRVYDLYLDVSWRFFNREWWGIAGGITPGFYGDFVRMDGDVFQLTGWLLGDWTLSEQWSIVAGLAYVRQLDSQLVPVGGATWRPTPDSRFDFIFPRPRIARRLFQNDERDLWVYVAGVFGGGAWAVDDGAGANVLVQYSDLRLITGIEIARTSGRITTIELGYVFARDITVDSTSLASPGDTLLLQGAVAF